MFGLTRKIETAARTAAVFSIGGVLAAVGLGFLTVAAWIVLASAHSPAVAATVIGSGYLGLGLICIGLGARRKDHPQPAAVPHTQRGDLSPMQLVAVSFLQGLEQGAAVRSTRT